jgi:hypothetical protein
VLDSSGFPALPTTERGSAKTRNGPDSPRGPSPLASGAPTARTPDSGVRLRGSDSGGQTPGSDSGVRLRGQTPGSDSGVRLLEKGVYSFVFGTGSRALGGHQERGFAGIRSDEADARATATATAAVGGAARETPPDGRPNSLAPASASSASCKQTLVPGACGSARTFTCAAEPLCKESDPLAAPLCSQTRACSPVAHQRRGHGSHG